LRRIGIVFYRDLKELLQSNAFRIIVIVVTVITVTAVIIISIILRRQEWLGEEIARPILELIISLIVYFLPLFILMTFIWAFASLPVTKEKVNGNISSLLATPLSPKEIWIGKSLAVFLPGLAVSIISTLIVLVTVNFTAIIPATGNFVLRVPIIITGFITNPLLFFCLVLFIILFSMASNPDVAITPSFLVGFGLMMGIPLGIATGVINLASWSFSLWYAAGVLIVLVAVFFFSYMLTKENIVLSSRGE